MRKETFEDDDGEIYDQELSPMMQAQLERLEQNSLYRSDFQFDSRRDKHKLRRQIEDFSEVRKMRREIDYLH
jgi:hypothetical protein